MRGAEEGERLVARLVAAVGVEGFLDGDNLVEVARQEEPLPPGLEPVRVLTQALRRVLLRVNRNGDHTHAREVCAELLLCRRESPAHYRTDGRAGGEDELQEDWPVVLQRGG